MSELFTGLALGIGYIVLGLTILILICYIIAKIMETKFCDFVFVLVDFYNELPRIVQLILCVIWFAFVIYLLVII
jgi:hypothetical protein